MKWCNKPLNRGETAQCRRLGLHRLRLGLCVLLTLLLPSQVLYAQIHVLGPKDANLELVVYSSTDFDVFEPVLAHYSQRHPTLRIVYHDLLSTEVYARVKESQDHGTAGADVAFSSAMDLQMKLANDGYARTYHSVLTQQLPTWARWRDEAFAVTFEPAVTVYNSDQLKGSDLPNNRQALADWLQRNQQQLYGKVTTYDAGKSGVGFLLASQDAKRGQALWALRRAFASTKVKLYSNAKVMLDRVAKGSSWMAYNVLGSYTRQRQQLYPQLKILPLNDYKLVLSRVVLLPNQSQNPAQGEAFLNFLLSPSGQQLMEEKAYLTSLSRAHQTMRDPAGALLQPVALTTGLLVSLDRAKRERFLKRWNHSLSRP